VVSDAPEGEKRIAVCHIASGDRWAGAEIQVAALLKYLARMTAFRVSAILLNEGRLADELRKHGVEVKVIPESIHSFLRIVRQGEAFLKGGDFKILHSHRYKENLLAALLSWRCRVPVVVRTQHGRPEPFEGKARIKHGAVQQIDRLTARRSTDCIIAVTRDLREYILKYADPGKVTYIHNGIDIEEVCSALSSREAKESLGIPAGSLVIGTAGRLEPVKRLDLFLATSSLLAKEHPSARFVIAGDGSEETRLRALSSSSGLGEKVLFLGHRDNIYDVLRSLDLFLMTSDHEGLPTALLEAMYLGVPVVARRVGGIPEVVEDGVQGLLIPSDDPAVMSEGCLKLLRDAGLRAQLADAGKRRIIEHFTSERAAAEVAKLYVKLCGKR
jgi:glycosyltransferase involved in cell wall biosynthesis